MKTRRVLLTAVLLAGLFVMSTLLVAAAGTFNVNYGSADVVTSPVTDAEWAVSPLNPTSNPDYITDTCIAGDCTKTHTGHLFMRYACDPSNPATGTLYFLVIEAAGQQYVGDPSNDWIALTSVNNKILNDGPPYTTNTNPPVWRDLTDGTGFEAAYNFAPGTYSLNIHAYIGPPGSPTTSSTGFINIVLNCIQPASQAGPASLGANVTDTFTITENGMKAPATGSVQWSWCYTASVPPPFPLPNGCLPSDPSFQALDGPVSPGNVSGTTTTWTSPVLVPGQQGTYCFYALYTPDSTSSTNGYSAISHTNSSTQCFVITTPTAVTLSSFKASVGSAAVPGRITLNWATGSEINTAGFNVYRSEHVDGPYVRINSQLIPASSDALAGGKYQYQDTAIVPGTTYYYQLEDVELNGASTRHAPIAAAAPVASTFNTTAVTLLGLALGMLAVVVGVVYLRRYKSKTA